jgi:hypothetical protein
LKGGSWCFERWQENINGWMLMPENRQLVTYTGGLEL